MSLAEGNAGLTHQPVGKIGGGGEAAFGQRPHPIRAEGGAFDHAGHRGEAEPEQIMALEDRRLIVLHVLRIREWQALHRHHQADEAAGNPAGVPAHQLGRIGIALLRHDRAAGGPLVTQRDEAERLRRPEDEFFREAREVKRALRGAGEIFDRKIAVRHRVERVARRPVEAERSGGGVAIDRETSAGERRGAERRQVHAGAGIAEAADVAPRHLYISHQMVAERDGLRRLEVGEAGHHAAGMFLRPGEQAALEGREGGERFVDRVAHP